MSILILKYFVTAVTVRNSSDTFTVTLRLNYNNIFNKKAFNA